MGRKIFTIYLAKADFDFVEKEVGIKDKVDFKKIEKYEHNQYKISISEDELESMAQIIAHSCDYIKSDKKAGRLDDIALMLENYLDQF